jgi:murein DD-endopeptidase MepM/ murein hydrolase activator NlpD
MTITPSLIPPILTLSPTALKPTTTPGPIICSPLEGITIPELPELIYNPFAPPRLGSDDPHQGVDFADIDPVYQIALEGGTVQAVLSGRVAAVIEDRFPYGYAVLVETPLDQVPPGWLATFQMPTPAPTQESHPSLTCPKSEITPNWDFSQRSLYLMYAHLKEPFTLQVGDQVSCGQELNAIGNSGNSLNPHLHVEARVGPANATFESIAHYTGSASSEEMQNYCLWRVSETFQLLDPMLLFYSQ